MCRQSLFTKESFHCHLISIALTEKWPNPGDILPLIIIIIIIEGVGGKKALSDFWLTSRFSFRISLYLLVRIRRI